MMTTILLATMLAATQVATPVSESVVVKYDRAGRSYWLELTAANSVAEWSVTYPNPDDESPVRRETATLVNTKMHPNTVFRRRFPQKGEEWTLGVTLNGSADVISEGEITVRRPHPTISAPLPNGEILVGVVGYNSASAEAAAQRGFNENANELLRDIFESDLCNFCVSWWGIRQLMPESWPAGVDWQRKLDAGEFAAMSIYSGDDHATQEAAKAAFKGRYFGNNVGEMGSFLYQSGREPNMVYDGDLQLAKDTFVNRFVGTSTVTGSRVGSFDYDLTFSTCGAALSCYELQGGIDFICNELWAIGAENLAHASSEARGAARKWKPEYWGGWNAHDWQTRAIPSPTDVKFDSLLVGFLEEYIAGTSMIILESGTQGLQSRPYMADPTIPEGYESETARRYRATVKRFYDFVKANPRGEATPETKIAMTLGNLDGYLGQDGAFDVWAQHDNAATNQLWKYGTPEHTQALVEDVFFPRPPALTAPYRNTWIGGTPYGQVDVMQIDDDSTLADLTRYALVVFGGWNTMTSHVKDVLERYVKEGGTLVMSRPELTTRIDRDYVGYTDNDLLPLFDFLPPEGAPGEFVETKVGKGRYILFTAHDFPSASEMGKAAYAAKVRTLAAEVEQTVKIAATGDKDACEAIVYGVYPEKLYFLNADTTTRHTFAYTLAGGAPKTLTLAPCEIVVVERDRITVTHDGGRLIFSGSGEMEAFASFADTPWAGAAASITALEVDSRIDALPLSAISGLIALKTINGAPIEEIENLIGKPISNLLIPAADGTISTNTQKLLDMKKILIAAAAVCASMTTVAGGVISINIASDGPKMSDQGGRAPGLSGVEGVTSASWNDIVNLEQTEAVSLKVWNEEKVVIPEGLSATWTFKGFYGTGDSPDVFRRRWSNTTGAGEWAVNLSGIPFKKYDVICYMNWDGTGTWSPIKINDNYWTYDAELGQSRISQSNEKWGSTETGVSGETQIGINAIRVPNITGSTLSLYGNQFANVCAIQIVEATKWNTADAISFNFASTYASMSEQPGLDGGLSGKEILASSWNDIDALTGTNTSLKVWNGKTLSAEICEKLKASWTIKGVYGWGSSPCIFRRGWCNASGAGAWSIDVAGIPFKEYDLYLYMNWDGTSDNPCFWSSVTVNGVEWMYDEDSKSAVQGSGEWGWAKGPNVEAIMGENAFCIPGVAGSSLRLKASGHANICAFQIVKRPDYDEYVADDDVTTAEINRLFGAARHVYVTIPAGGQLTLSKKEPMCERLFICCEGDCIIDTDYDPADPEKREVFEATMAKLDTTCVEGVVYHGWKPTAGVISINFNSNKGSMSDQVGFAGAFAGEEVPAVSWNDIAEKKGENVALKVWKGREIRLVSSENSEVLLTWSANDNYHKTEGVVDNFLKGYLDDSGNTQITISEIPFEKYDFYITYSADWNRDTWQGDFDALKLNDKYYVWSMAEKTTVLTDDAKATWGKFMQPRAELGVNTLCVKDLTDRQLSIAVGGRGNHRAGICAIQIVEPAPKRHYPKGYLIMLR